MHVSDIVEIYKEKLVEITVFKRTWSLRVMFQFHEKYILFFCRMIGFLQNYKLCIQLFIRFWSIVDGFLII